LDSSLEFYEVSERSHTVPAVNSQKPKTKSCFKNLFSRNFTNSGANELQPNSATLPKFKYSQVLVVQNAHDTEINCIKALPTYGHWQVHFITGATREIKMWSRG